VDEELPDLFWYLNSKYVFEVWTPWRTKVCAAAAIGHLVAGLGAAAVDSEGNSPWPTEMSTKSAIARVFGSVREIGRAHV
jgi:hypothetical protein